MVFPDYTGQRGLDNVDDHRAEGLADGLCEALALIPCYAALCADELEQQAARIGDLKIHLAGNAQLQRGARQRVDKAYLVRRAPLDGHLHRLVDEVHLGVEGALGVCGELVETFKQRELLRLQRVAPRAEEVERLSVAEEDGLLTLVDYQLRAEVEVLDRVLPDECFVVALELDYAGEPVLLDLLGEQAFLHVVDVVADGAGVCRRGLACAQTDAAFFAGELRNLIAVGLRVYSFSADGTARPFALALVEHDGVAAVGTFAACHFVGADVDSVTAGAVDFLPCEEPRLGLCVFPAAWALNYKFRHVTAPLYRRSVFH